MHIKLIVTVENSLSNSVLYHNRTPKRTCLQRFFYPMTRSSIEERLQKSLPQFSKIYLIYNILYILLFSETYALETKKQIILSRY